MPSTHPDPGTGGGWALTSMLQDDWKAQLAMWREDKRERQRARERKQKLPPNPHHNPRGWMEWKQTHDFLDLQGRELWR